MLGSRRAGGYLPALQAQAADTGDRGARTRAGAAGKQHHGAKFARHRTAGAAFRHGRRTDSGGGDSRGVRHHRRAGVGGRARPQQRTPHGGPRRRSSLPARERQGAGRGQIFGLLRCDVAAAHRFIAPLSGHAPRHGRRSPEDLGGDGRRPHYGRALPPVRTPRLGDARMDGSCRRGLVQTSDTALDRDRTAGGGQGEGRRRSDPGIRRKPAAAAALGAARTEAHHRRRPRIPHGLQSRGARRATCCTTPPSIPIRRRTVTPKPPKRCGRWRPGTRPKPSP